MAEKLLAGDDFKRSQNDYDWLGHGIYFWEANPNRGLSFAQEAASRRRAGPRIARPAVVGAIIDMGLCLDLTTTAGVSEVRAAYEAYKEIVASSGLPTPTNSKDKLRRSLDCAVINTLHRIRAGEGDVAIDTVKGVFAEGNPIYPEAGILEKTHIQICVRSSDCIKPISADSHRSGASGIRRRGRGPHHGTDQNTNATGSLDLYRIGHRQGRCYIDAYFPIWNRVPSPFLPP